MYKNYTKLSFIVIAALALGMPLSAQRKTGTLDAPSLQHSASSGSSISVTVTAGPSGAPAGFSLQWMLKSDLPWPAEGGYEPPSFCKGGFSGNAQGAAFELAPGASVTIWVGDVLYDTPGATSSCASTPLQCGEEYVFRAFAHATSTMFKSAWSANRTASTLACASEGCTYSQGYWKTHGPVPTGNNLNEWPVASLALGNVTYTDLQILSILNTPGAGNGLIPLAHQLIAARLNEANGADVSSVAAVMAQADTLIGGLVVPPVGSGSLHSSTTGALTSALTSYNEGLTGPGHCE